jgi:hypothetical protein
MSARTEYAVFVGGKFYVVWTAIVWLVCSGLLVATVIISPSLGRDDFALVIAEEKAPPQPLELDAEKYQKPAADAFERKERQWTRYAGDVESKLWIAQQALKMGASQLQRVSILFWCVFTFLGWSALIWFRGLVALRAENEEQTQEAGKNAGCS